MPTSDTLPDSRDFSRPSLLEIPTLCLGNALGSCCAGAMPLWVADLTRAGMLSTSHIGWLASGELFAMAISIFALSAWGKYANPRWVTAAAASAAVISNVFSIFPTTHTLIVGRLLSGLAMGVLLASVTRVAARRGDAQRVLTLMQAMAVILMSAIYFLSPALLSRFGAAGIFGAFASIGAALTVAAVTGLPTATEVPDTVTRVTTTQRLAPLLVCLALAVVFIGHNSVWTYIISIGNSLGFDTPTMGTVLSIAPPLALLGPIAAHIVGERVGLLRPVLLSLILLALNILLLVDATSLILFCVYTAALHVWISFCVPYAIALLGRLDNSGRFASAAPAFMMVGGAAGPALGSKMITVAGGFHTLALVALSNIALGIALFAAAASLHDKLGGSRDGMKS